LQVAAALTGRMGCGGSTAKEKAAIASAKFDFKQTWTGIRTARRSMPTDENVLICKKMGKGKGQLQHTDGTVLLDVVPWHGDKATWHGDKATFFNTPDGKTVVLCANTIKGDLYERTACEWVVWTAEDAAQIGQSPEATPTGASMYKFGTIKLKNESVSFFDASATKVMKTKGGHALGNTVKLYSADGTIPMAVVEDMWEGELAWEGTVTFAKGVDPIIALCMAAEGNSFALSQANLENQLAASY